MFSLETANIERAITNAKALHPKVKMIEFGKYEVTGSLGNTYTVLLVLHLQPFSKERYPMQQANSITASGAPQKTIHSGSAADGHKLTGVDGYITHKGAVRTALKQVRDEQPAPVVASHQRQERLATASTRIRPGDRVLIYDALIAQNVWIEVDDILITGGRTKLRSSNMSFFFDESLIIRHRKGARR
jgi:hypothetical protein